ncbi:hypothetical protein [Algibacillus agarilyticus]|uniref:hypothetical protein n=1 Tax=Algibacillus agarilyticus TaxID=2234133 RepID=UPI000DD02E1C|nr:hypothetical protein [Algibacillus agarilyticus]
MFKYYFILYIFTYLLFCTTAKADGAVVDKVYHPYVLANEQELEWRLMSTKKHDRNVLAQRLGYGHALNERITLEGYIIAERDDQFSDFSWQAVELEVRWMLTEQGQYSADWGLLFELEKDRILNNWELTTGLLFEKEFGITSLTINAFVINEWGSTLKSEMEFESRVKYRYRWRPALQPAIEIYTGEDFIGIGPAGMGIIRFDKQKQLKWELGFITELSQATREHALRFAIEYEF